MEALGLLREMYSNRWPCVNDGNRNQAEEARGEHSSGADGLGTAESSLEPSEQPFTFEEMQIGVLEQCLPSSGWGEGLWCFNPYCMNMEGPSELQLKTYACGGGCGVRYCSETCQAQAWREGHKMSCRRRP